MSPLSTVSISAVCCVLVRHILMICQPKRAGEPFKLKMHYKEGEDDHCPQWQSLGQKSDSSTRQPSDVLNDHWDWEMIGYREFASGITRFMGVEFIKHFKAAARHNAFGTDIARSSWHSLLRANLLLSEANHGVFKHLFNQEMIDKKDKYLQDLQKRNWKDNADSRGRTYCITVTEVFNMRVGISRICSGITLLFAA